MAAFTSKATGNWSASGQTTWNESGVPGSGDTVTIGAHTVTVDVNTTVGTSPNDTTTKVLDKNSATGSLTVASGVTLTMKGNIGAVNGSKFVLNSGASLVFDPSGSGGTPVYGIVNIGSIKLDINGTIGSRCTVSAPVGYTFSLNDSYSELVVTFCDFTRHGEDLQFNAPGIALTFTDNTFTSCGKLTILSGSGGTQDRIINRNVFSAGTSTTLDLKLSITAAYTSGLRQFIGNVIAGPFTYDSQQMVFEQNYLGTGLDGVATRLYASFQNNFIHGQRTNGQYIPNSINNNYFFSDTSFGNPHFLCPSAVGVDSIYEYNIFESAAPDIVDTGDCFLMTSGIAATSGGAKIIGRYNIVLRNAFGGVASGTLITILGFTGALSTEWTHNTVNIDNSIVPSAGKRGSFAVAEGGAGAADEVSIVKSNCVWGSAAAQGFVAERISGNVKDILTASGVDYNWTYNLSAGNNQRGYEDRGAATLWTAGDAVAAGVDVHQGSGDPLFVDSARNLTKWAVTRGYGTTNDDGLTALRADPSRAADLLAYVRAGFAPRNASLRNAGHDGVTIGAVEFAATYLERHPTRGVNRGLVAA